MSERLVVEAPSAFDGNEESGRAEAVAADHYLHWLAVLVSAAYAWKLHGLLIAVAVLIGLLAVISVTNLILLAKSGSFKLIRVNRWSWVILAFVILAASGASGGRI